MEAQRWKIVRSSSPAQRRASEPYLRERVLVRCVCGQERVIWLEEIQRGRSTGCGSRRCRARHELAQEIRAQAARFTTVAEVLDFAERWVREGRERDEERAMAEFEDEG